MKAILYKIFCFSGMLLYTFTTIAQLKVDHLRTEYKENPIGIDVTRPRLSWQLTGTHNGTQQIAYQVRASNTITGLNNKQNLLWNSGKVTSDKSIQVPYSGPHPKSGERIYWQVRVWDKHGNTSPWSQAAFFEMGLLNPKEWKAHWITSGFTIDTLRSNPSPYFRNSFTLNKKIKAARIYVTSLGLYDLFLNGEKVGDQVFTPGWTSYNKRLQYQTYDVTNQLKPGGNAIGAILGDGWYRGQIGWEDYNRNRYGTRLALLLQLEIIFIDGTKKTITTDPSWKVKTGAIRSSDIYAGEQYDARLFFNGWSTSSFDDKRWKPVEILDHPTSMLVASCGPPVKRIQELKPIELMTTLKGEKVFDLGQIITGWVRLKIKGTKGDTITLSFAEVLDQNGNFYTDNLRKAKAEDVYILSGKGTEVYEPHFTYHGFRYVKVEGAEGKLTPDAITGIVIHSDIAPTGHFSCSDSLINQLWHNIVWSQKGNFLDVPTDCPQRDERLGWTGDAQVFSPTACYNFNSAGFFEKWLKDLKADQWDNGLVPDVIPDILNVNHQPALHGKPFWGASTGWADAAIIIPWNLYRFYADKRVLKEQYASMKAWIEYMKNRAGSDYLWDGDKHYGDWLSFSSNDSGFPGAYTDVDLIATAYYAHSCDLMSKIARILGKPEDAGVYKDLFNNIKAAFNKTYVTSAGYLMSNTQTAYAIALKFHLLPKNKVPLASQHLADRITAFDHITTGFLGTPLLCPVLTQTERDSLAYLLLNRKTYPSWLYPVTRGATTIWERWDGIKPDGTFQTTGMNSFNHYAYGAIGQWLYGTVAGIMPDVHQPGFKHIILAPHPGGGLSSAQASYHSMYGKILSKWEISNGRMRYTVVIPSNTTANITLPAAANVAVLVNDKDLHQIKYISQLTREQNNLIFEVESGTYTFEYPIKDKSLL